MCIVKNYVFMLWTGLLILNVNDFFWIIFLVEDVQFFISKVRKSYFQIFLIFSIGIYFLKGVLLIIYRL